MVDELFYLQVWQEGTEVFDEVVGVWIGEAFLEKGWVDKVRSQGFGAWKWSSVMVWSERKVIVGKILFGCIVVAAFVDVVADADMVGEVVAGLGVDIAGELVGLVAGWTGESGAAAFVGLEGEH